jgi:hypothetical protein
MLVGLMVSPVTVNGFSVRVAEARTPLYVALISACVADVIGVVAMVKVPLILPSGIKSDAGTVASPTELARDNKMPPTGATLER